MRNLKKLLAVIVAICVLASFTVPAFAAESFTYDAQAQKLYDMGLFKGNSETQYVPNLGGSLTREAGTILLVRLFGVEADAKALTDADTILAGYTDAKNVSPWAKNYVAYAVKTKLVEGTTATNLSPSKALDGNTLATLILRKLGYTVSAADFSKAAATLVEKGGITAEQATKFAGKDLIRDDAVGIMFGSLMAKDTDNKTVIAKLVAAKVVDEAKAIAAGVWTAAPAVPAVASISGTNLKELAVVFAGEVDKTTAETAGNYTVGGTAVEKATLGADNKTVTILVPDAKIIANGASYDVVVKKGVKNTAGVEMAADYKTAVRVIDNVLPDATAITLTGPQTFDITFNEPIKTTGTVKVNNGIYGNNVTISGNTATVKLAASSLPDANYTINLSGFKDYAGFSMIAKDITLAYAKETSAISASVTSATQTKVVVAFNRPVKLAEPATAYFYQTYSAWMPEKATSSDNGKTWTLEFTKYYVVAGSTNLVIRHSANSTDMADLWGNKLAADITLPLTVSADTTAPTVLASKTAVDDEMTVKIYFSEDMKKELAEDESKFTVKDSAGKKVTTAFTNTYTANTTTGEYYVTMKFLNKLDGGNYTVDIADQTDISLSANKLATVTVPFTITDMTAMDPTKITVDGIAGATDSDAETIYVTFPEKIATTGQFSATSGDNYLLNAGGTVKTITKLEGTVETFGASGKVVKISVPHVAGFTIGASKLVIGRIADLSNQVYSYPTSVEMVIGGTAKPAVDKVKLTADNKLEIHVNQLLQSIAGGAFTVTGSGITGDEVLVESWAADSDGKGTTVKAALTPKTVDALKVAIPGYSANTSLTFGSASIYLGVIGENIVAETGKKADNATHSALDYRAPVVVTDGITTGGALGCSTTGSIAIKFSEALDGGIANLYTNDLVIVKVDADGTTTTLTPGLDYKTVRDSANIIMIVKANGTALDAATYQVKSKDTITYIRDASAQNNGAAAFTTVVEVVIK